MKRNTYTNHLLLKQIMDGLRRASNSDPLLGGKSHSHGWGYVLLQDDRIYEYHSYKPIYLDRRGYDKLLETIRDSEEYSMGIIHSRRASRNNPLGLLHTYPYHYMVENGIDLWLAFNGSMKTYGETSRTDAYILGRELVEKCRHHSGLDGFIKCIVEEYRGLRDRIVSGGILLSMITQSIDDRIDSAIILHPIYKTSRRSLKEYYRYYLLKRNDLEAIMSSSIVHYIKDLEEDVKPVREGEPLIFRRTR